MRASSAPRVADHLPDAQPGASILGPRDRLLLCVLIGVGLAEVGMATAPGLMRSDRLLAGRIGVEAIGLLVASIASGVILLLLSREPGAWRGTQFLAVGALGSAAIQAGALASGQVGEGRTGSAALGTIVLLVSYACVAVVEHRQHRLWARPEILSDVALVATITGAAAYLLVRTSVPGGPSAWDYTVGGSLILAAMIVFAAWSVLALWCPTKVHFVLLVSATIVAVAAPLASPLMGWPTGAAGMPEGAGVAVSLAILATTGALVVEARLFEGRARPPLSIWWVRPTLLLFSLFGAWAVLVGAVGSPRLGLGMEESAILAAVVFGVMGVRMLLNQMETVRAARGLGEALDQRETAIQSMQEASDAIARSEARLRLLLDSAVDGIVELDGEGIIVRANDAFCAMIEVPLERVVGRSWIEMAGPEAGRDHPLATLPQTGQAVVPREGGQVHLEARSSTVPGNPPGELLLIRDVTASKVAEQTIRSLFQFLQDRDEDRTRLLQRTNAAIEAERNRIARDLHDGPVQGVSAAALSIEAIRLMLESGDLPLASETLDKVRAELAEETGNLRRVMSDLRPPLLEERGLVPAARDLGQRFERETGVVVTVEPRPYGIVPSDIETLAYRVIQEALSNVAKHAKAGNVAVRIEVSNGALMVEVTDDGAGFDASQTRDFLRLGRVGLASMRERAELGGGSLSIRSAPGAGTTVSAVLPFDLLSRLPSPPR